MAEAAANNTLAELTVPIRGDLTPLAKDMAEARRQLEAFRNSMGGGLGGGNAANDQVKKLGRDLQAANDNAQKLNNSLGKVGASVGGFNQLTGSVNNVTMGLDAYRNATVQAAAADQQLAAGANAVAPALANETQQVNQNTLAKERNTKVSRMAASQQRVLAYQLVDVTQMLAMGQAPLMTLIQQGPQIAQIYGPSEGGLGRAFSESAKMVGSLIAKMPVLTAAIVVAGGAIFNMKSQISGAGNEAITFGDVIIGLFKTIGDYVSDFLSPMFPYVSAAWDWLTSTTKNVANEIIQSFQVAYNDLKFVFLQFPNIVAAGVAGAANMVVAGIESMINFAILGLNKLVIAANNITAKLPGALPDMMKMGEIPDVKLGRVNAGTADKELRDAMAERLKRQQEIIGGDPVGEFMNDWRDNSVSTMRERLDKKNKGKTKKEDPFAKIMREGQQFIAEQKLEAQAIGMTAEKAAALRYEQDMLNKAQDANLKLTPKQTEEIKKLAVEMAAAEEQTRKMQEAYNFSKDVFKGFFTDVVSGLRNGESIWESFGNAAMNALNKIADKLMDMALNGLFDQLWGSIGGSGGSSGGGLGGLIGKLFGFANGTNYAPGGWSVVGEKGPELMKMPGGTQIVSNNRLAGHGISGGSSGASGRIELAVFVQDDGKIGAIARQAGAEAGREQFDIGINVYDQEQLPESMNRVSNNPRMR